LQDSREKAPFAAEAGVAPTSGSSSIHVTSPDDELPAVRHDLPPLTPNPVIEAYKQDIDRTLLRENLRLSVEERFVKHMQFQQFAEELRRAGRAASDRGRPI
jgi:hypothetical protein